MREFKLPGIELRSCNGRAFKDLTAADVAEVAAAAVAGGWRVVGCATPVFKCDLDDTAAIAAHREIFKRSLEVARALNCDLLRVFTFLRTPNPDEPAKQRRVVEHLQGLLDLAAGSGIRLGVENEHSCLAATAGETAAILAPLPADRIGSIWDPCNVLYVPGAAAPTPADLRLLAARMIHLHVKTRCGSRRRSPANTSQPGRRSGWVRWIGAGISACCANSATPACSRSRRTGGWRRSTKRCCTCPPAMRSRTAAKWRAARACTTCGRCWSIEVAELVDGPVLTVSRGGGHAGSMPSRISPKKKKLPWLKLAVLAGVLLVGAALLLRGAHPGN